MTPVETIAFPEPIPFLQARDFRPSRVGGAVRNVVIHTAEIGESLQGAEALMRACAAGRPPKPDGSPNLASWHYSVDADSICQSVKEEHTAFHAPGLSHRSVGIELSGRARQTREEWFDEFSIRTLELTAMLTARLCQRWSIPLVRCDATMLRNQLPGITGHADVSQAFRKSSHWDPGPGFPWGYFLERVTARWEALPTDALPPPAEATPTRERSTLRVGANGPDVVYLQDRLKAHGYGVGRNGVFSPYVEDVLREFQRAQLIEDDGVCGPITWSKLEAAP